MPSLNPTEIDDENWQHGKVFVDDAREVRIHYIDCPSFGGTEKGVLLLIHGYPNTSYQWRHVITPFAKAGYRVIAPDYRGAGDSSHPKLGYDKVTIANDLYKIAHDHLGVKSPLHVVGQDIGGMIAHAYAASHPDHTRSVMWGECPLPGSTPYESGFKTSPGREKIYIKHFYDRLCFNPVAITPRDVDHYATSFAQPGGMRAGFELYRSFPQDAKDNRAKLDQGGHLKTPAAALCGEMSLLLEVAEEQTREFYQHVEVVTVDKSGHWTAEENPKDFVEKVLRFIEKHN